MSLTLSIIEKGSPVLLGSWLRWPPNEWSLSVIPWNLSTKLVRESGIEATSVMLFTFGIDPVWCIEKNCFNGYPSMALKHIDYLWYVMSLEHMQLYYLLLPFDLMPSYVIGFVRYLAWGTKRINAWLDLQEFHNRGMHLKNDESHRSLFPVEQEIKKFK